jgi:hypothetical protein
MARQTATVGGTAKMQTPMQAPGNPRSPFTRALVARTLALGATALLVLAACDSADEPAQTGNRPEIGSTELKVMTFNIWLGGEVVDFAKVVDAGPLHGWPCPSRSPRTCRQAVGAAAR